MESYIRKLGRNSIFISILLIVLSIFMIARPETTLSTIIILFGYVLVFDGLIHFLSYFTIKNEYRYFSYELAQAIIDVVLGFIIVCNVASVRTFLPIVLGIWIVLESILKIQIAFNIRGVRDTKWGIMFFMSLVSVALGVGMIAYPISSSDALIKIAGCVLLFTQIMNLYNDIYIINEFKKINKAIKNVKSAMDEGNVEVDVEEIVIEEKPKKATTKAKTTTRKTTVKKTTVKPKTKSSTTTKKKTK